MRGEVEEAEEGKGGRNGRRGWRRGHRREEGERRWGEGVKGKVMGMRVEKRDR